MSDSKAKLSGSKLTAGRLSGGRLTAGQLRNATRHLYHPKVLEKLDGSGFFDKMSNIINVANKAVGAVGGIKKVVDVGKTLYGAKQKLDKLKGGKLAGGVLVAGKVPVLRRKSVYNKMLENEELPEDEGGKLKTKRKLPEALKKRAVALGKYMKQGYSMKEASDLYKANGK